MRTRIRWITSTIDGTVVDVYDRGLLLRFPDESLVGIRMRQWAAAQVFNVVRRV